MISQRTKRLVFLACALLVAGGLSYSFNTALQRDAAFLLDKELAALEGPGLEARGRVTTSRDFLFFGTARAKVEVYLRDTNKQELLPAGFEFYYTKSGAVWVPEGSGRCTSEECAARAKEIFATTPNPMPRNLPTPE